MFLFLPSFGFIFDFKSPLGQNPSYKPVFGSLAPHSSLHYSVEIGLHVPGLLKEQFWTLSGLLKAPRSLKVLGSLKVLYNTYVTPASCFWIKNFLHYFHMQLLKLFPNFMSNIRIIIEYN